MITYFISIVLGFSIVNGWQLTLGCFLLTRVHSP
jgi:hypothetical protein